MPRPPREVTIDAELVRQLVREQAPDYLDLEPVFAEEGWDNVVFRMGDALAARIPRRQVGADLLLAEQNWLDEAASALELEVPRHIFKGKPTEYYPWSWSIVAWVEGRAADVEPMRPDQAAPLARQLRLLHRRAPENAPFNPFRSTSLLARADEMFGRLDRLGLPDLAPVWQRAISLPAPQERVWIHGDLHPGNVIVRDGHLAGIIDWGDLCHGDPAGDLAAGYYFFDPEPAGRAFFEAYGATPEERTRAAGWAIAVVAAILEADDPRHVPSARRIAAQLSAES